MAERRAAPGRPPGRTAPRAAILRAAAGLFAARGYDGTSLNDIAAQVGLTKAGLYHYFASKHEIFDRIILQLLAEMQAEVSAAVAAAAAAGPEARLAAFMRGHADFLARHLAEFRTLFGGRGGAAAPYTPDEIAARRAYEAGLVAILEDGRQSGAFAFADAGEQARAILGMLNWMSRWWRPGRDRPAAEIAADFHRTFCLGLRPR
jgi:AcrR family transcriptional regulator